MRRLPSRTPTINRHTRLDEMTLNKDYGAQEALEAVKHAKAVVLS